MRIHPQTQQPLPESTVLACVAQCYKTADFYAARGERGLFEWWSNQGDRIAERLAVYRDIQAARLQLAGTADGFQLDCTRCHYLSRP